MGRKTICFSLLIFLLGVVPSHRAMAQQLTEHEVRATLDKLGQGSATVDFTVTDAQDQQLNSLSAEVRGSLVQTDSPCVLNPRDPRVLSHQFVVCKGLFPPGMGFRQSAHYVKLTHPCPWHVLVITIPTDPGDDPNQMLVQYTWEYDFSGLPPQVQQILKGSAPRPGMSLFRLDGGAWQWAGYR
ncbi:MAG: hypothetical protein WBD46_17185 [Acidobacteriaceae bacterium]